MRAPGSTASSRVQHVRTSVETNSVELLRPLAQFARRRAAILLLLSVSAFTLVPRTSVSAQGVSPARPPVREIRPPTPERPQRGAAAHDVLLGKRALQLTALQEQTMAAVRARYRPLIIAYVTQLNTLQTQQSSDAAVSATRDTLRQLLLAERVALDSLITPEQRQRFEAAVRQANLAATAPPPPGARP